METLAAGSPVLKLIVVVLGAVADLVGHTFGAQQASQSVSLKTKLNGWLFGCFEQDFLVRLCQVRFSLVSVPASRRGTSGGVRLGVEQGREYCV
jgi:hypothetical protein